MSAAHAAGAHYLHFDVMDAHFVPNLSFGPGVIQSVRNASSRLFDVHLMVTEPTRHLDLFLSSEGDLFTLHVEACTDVGNALQAFRSASKRVGLAIKPGTPVETLLPFLSDLDLVLVMTVDPGWGGQAFMPDMLDKVRVLRRAIDQEGLDVRLQVDGGINTETAGCFSPRRGRRAGRRVFYFCPRLYGGRYNGAHDACLETGGHINCTG